MSLIETVISVRNRYGELLHPEDPQDDRRTPMTSTEIGEAMNAIVWPHRNEWTLVAKSHGNHVLQPGTGIGISRDLVMNRGSKKMYDVFRAVAGAGQPQWLYQGIATTEQPVFAVNPGDDEPVEPIEPNDVRIRNALTEVAKAQTALSEATEQLNRALAQE